MKNKKIVRSNEKLWEACKKEAVEKLGKFSARAMQQAVILYKQKGGTYLSEKSADNPLTKWNDEQNSN